VSAGLLMGYVRLLMEQQSKLVSLDGLMRNGLALEAQGGLAAKSPQERRGRTSVWAQA
jgi:hypothetical protein